jgi:glutamyl-tRNA reductase
MTTPLRCVIVGAGRIAQTYAQAFASTGELRAAAIVDTNAATAQKMADALGCPAYADADEFLASRTGIDAVILCTPPATGHPSNPRRAVHETGAARPLRKAVLSRYRHGQSDDPHGPRFGRRADNGVEVPLC